MRTEPPVDHLLRRLGEQPARDADQAEESDASASLLPRWLPEADGNRSLREQFSALRADPGRAGALALAGVAAVAVLVTIITLMRDDPAPVVSANLPSVEMAGTGSAAPAAPHTETPGPLVVSVVGLVQTPGLVTMTPGARVAEAITEAGGALAGADTVGLNMARRLADGEQVVVGVTAAPGAPPALGSSISGTGPQPDSPAPAPGAAVGPVDLNAATVEQLDALPGVGPITAEAIIAWRTQHGAFGSVDQLGEVDGIGPARLDKLRDQVRV